MSEQLSEDQNVFGEPSDVKPIVSRRPIAEELIEDIWRYENRNKRPVLRIYMGDEEYRRLLHEESKVSATYFLRPYDTFMGIRIYQVAEEKHLWVCG